jgi:hypothetical protein
MKKVSFLVSKKLPLLTTLFPNLTCLTKNGKKDNNKISCIINQALAISKTIRSINIQTYMGRVGHVSNLYVIYQ